MSGVFRKILFWLALCLALWFAGLFWFAQKVTAFPANDAMPTDAIVVLTGGAGRIEYGLSLLASGKGKKLFISGAGQNATIAAILRRAMPADREKLLPIASQTIVLGRLAENTIGNAEETERWLKSENYHSIRLVTANYHMPRSLEEFQEIMPDIIIVADPVFPDDFNLDSWWRSLDSRKLLLSEYHKYLAAELRHWFLALHRS